MTRSFIYAMASYVDGDTGEWSFVIPDLGIDIVRPTKTEALTARHFAVRSRMAALADAELDPPNPTSVKDAKMLDRSLAEWEWSVIAVPIANEDFV